MMSEERICVTVTVRQAELSQGEMYRLYSVLRVAVICFDRVSDIESKRFVSSRLVPFRWVLHFALSLTRSIIVHVVTLYTRENPLNECGRPCDNLSCPCFTALWLQLSQSFLIQENKPAKDIDLTCFKTFPNRSTTCLQVGPMSLDWPLDPIARFDQSSPSSSPEDLNDEQQGGALPASSRSRWRRDALQPPRRRAETHNPMGQRCQRVRTGTQSLVMVLVAGLVLLSARWLSVRRRYSASAGGQDAYSGMEIFNERQQTVANLAEFWAVCIADGENAKYSAFAAVDTTGAKSVGDARPHDIAKYCATSAAAAATTAAKASGEGHHRCWRYMDTTKPVLTESPNELHEDERSWSRTNGTSMPMQRLSW